MDKKITKKILMIVMVTTIVISDFLLIASHLITYATKQFNKETSNPNVEFSAYFKDGDTKTESILKTIDSEELKLYAEIKVKNEGYLKEGTIIEIENSNFNLKNEILSSNTHIKSIEGNKVVLKQIDNGNSIEIELGIEPKYAEKIETDYLTKASTVKILGTYIYSSAENGESVTADKLVCVNYQPSEETKAEIQTEIITNKIFEIEGINKRIIQQSIKSRLLNNEYPVKETMLNMDISKLSTVNPEISVLALGKLATNGLSEINSENYEIIDGKLQINIKNEIDSKNKINWNKDIYDELVVTYIYPENVDANELEILTGLEITVYNSDKTYLTSELATNENGKINSVITGKTEIVTEEMYKGKIYANLEEIYNTKTEIIITNEKIVDEITVKEGNDALATEEKEIDVKTKYVATEINVNKMLEILGTDGTVTIKNGETITTINKNTQTNDDGNVIINYENSVSEIEIKISKPEKTGILELKHTKSLTNKGNTREKLQTAKTLNAKSTTIATKEGVEIVKNSTEITTLELKETFSKAELKIENNKNTLSATEVNDVTLGITLVTDSIQYDLYKNPEIEIKFPEFVENVELISTPTQYNMEELNGINVEEYNPTTKILRINITGEQTTYPTSSLAQSYLQLNLGVSLSELATDKTDKIVMAYKNENATQYVDGRTEFGIVEKNIEISGKPGLQKIFNISLNNDKSQTKTIRQPITENNIGKTVTFETILVNNIGSDMNNVRILGKLPTEGNSISDEENVNTFKTQLTEMNASNATIYYTENINATEDIENAENGWITDLSTLTTAKMYLINLGTLSKGSSYTAQVKIQIPKVLEQGQESYTEYKVIYDTDTKTNISENSRKICLTTSTELYINLTAEVGQEVLNNGDIVKEGEVIKYKVTATNNTQEKLENIILNAKVPEGTVALEVEEMNEYLLNRYYKENTDLEEINITIPTLEAGETYTTQYEVRVNTDITSGTKITNKVNATYNDQTVESQEVINELQESNIRVTIKKAIDKAIKLTSGSEVQYDVIIENLSNETISGLKMEIISDDFVLESENIDINEIPGNGNLTIKLKGTIKKDAEKMHISANIEESNNMYRSNKIIEELLNANASITLTTPQNNKELKQGDDVEYNIVIKNIGDISEFFKVYYNVPEEFEIQTVRVNGKVISKSDEVKEISNLIYEGMNLEKGAEATIKITAKVKSLERSKVITNQAKVEVLNVYKDISEEITHKLIENTEKPIDPENPDKPVNPDNPENPNEPTNPEVKNTITGMAWIDSNRNGQKDNTEKNISGIKVKIYDVVSGKYLTNNEGNIIEKTTDAHGKYIVEDIIKGSYILIFEYDIEKYEPTTYMADGVDSTKASKVVLKNININGKEIKAAVTDTINVNENISNINIGLRENVIYDLELNKYISRIVVQNNKGTKAYDYDNKTLAKVEIHKKQMQGSLVVLEYTIKIKNNGEIPGYAKNIVDYLPNGLTFSSELNKDWYLSDNYLYTKSLENVEINPGEEKTVKLILTKTMTEDNVGLINNRAEIYKDYNQYGESDIDSIPNNQNQNEDDFSAADAIIQIATGGSGITHTILIMINVLLIAVAIKLMIKNGIITISIKGERR